MSRFSFEWFVARRISLSAEGESRGIMVRIAWVTTAVSMAVMIVAMAVIMGFKREIAARMMGLGAQVEIVSLKGSFDGGLTPIDRNPTLEEAIRSIDGFRNLYPYAVKGGIVKTDEAIQGILLKGVDSTFDGTFFSSVLQEGRLPQQRRDLLISRSLADLLLLEVGDKAEMLFVTPGFAPRRDRFRVCGIYSSGLDEMDRSLALTDLYSVQRLNGWSPDQFSGYEVNGTDFDRIEAFSEAVYLCTVANEEAEQPLRVANIVERYPSLFDWLKAHNVNVAVIIVIMLVVSLFSMISALLIILLERTSMIGTLKALGMANGPVQRIFLYRSARIVLRGLFWGNVVGVGFSLLQYHFKLVELDPSGYFLSYVPIDLDWSWWLLLNAGTFLFLLLLLVLPTSVISRISPVQTLRYQS